jgi:hypothetical protein
MIMQKLAKLFIAAAVACMAAWLPSSALAQFQAGLPMISMGYCQAASGTLAASSTFSACVGASFTGTCVGNQLTASAVTGDINSSWPLSGTGIVSGTYVVSGPSAGGAGVYTVSQSCTSSAASLTTIGPPIGATLVIMQAETQNIRWRDDNGAPTAAVGMLMATGAAPFGYAGTISQLHFIQASASAVLDASFYRSSSP